ncbi:MAG: hypothetical protein JWN98_2618, partial [Abditibacteriota bacterium]|nr:hypothetical protein [Abditibacteriota bacterium]
MKTLIVSPLLTVTAAFLTALTLALPAHALTISSSTHAKPIFYDFSVPVSTTAPTTTVPTTTAPTTTAAAPVAGKLVAVAATPAATGIPFASYAIPNGVPSGARFEVRDGALKITNEWAGSFGIDTRLKPFDANQMAHLFFDYKLAPDVKVNVFFRVKGKYHGAVFSGPARVRPGSVMLGTIEGVKADNQWHRAHIPIRDWLREWYPIDETLPVEEVIIGNWDNTNYLMAGFGGNGPGATWWMDNFALLGAESPAEEAKFEIKDAKGAPLADPQKYVYSLDGGKEAPLTAATLSLKPGEGLHWLRVTPKVATPAKPKAGGVAAASRATFGSAPGAAQGTVQGAAQSTLERASYAFWVSGKAPEIGAASLRMNDVVVPILAGAGANLKTAKLTVGGKSFDFSSPQLRWDGRALRVAAGEAGLQWKDGEKVTVAIEGVKDTLNRAAPNKSEAFTVDFSKHHEAVPPPRVQLANSDITVDDGTFEQDMDQWIGEGDGGALVERDSSTAASGRYSLRLTCPANAAPYRASIRRTPIDIGKYPILSFDYRVLPQLRVDIMLWFDGKPYSLAFTDHDNPYLKLGTIPVIADDQWHHAEINLAALLRTIKPDALNYRVDWIAIGDMGWLGNARGLQYWIDNFRFTPIERGAPLQATVSLPDVTGLKSTAWIIDEKPETVPPTDKTSGATIETSAGGRKWLHVRAQNGAGDWSPAVHMPVWLDAQTPQTGAVVPARDAKAAPISLEWELRDDLGLDPASLGVVVGGKEFAVGSPALSYDAGGGRLKWNARSALQSGGISTVANGAPFEWKLKAARDYAGNATLEQSGSFLYDFAQDKSGPVTHIASESHALLSRQDFEDEGNSWKAIEDVILEFGMRDDSGVPNRFLKITSTKDAAAISVAAYPQAFNDQKSSIVSFAYRLPPTANIALRVRLN